MRVYDGEVNMQRDRDLLSEQRVAWRVYGWERSWVSLGAHQVASDAVLPKVLIPTVRRPTGGYAVLHGHDVTLGLMVPLTALELGLAHARSVRRIYRELAGIIAEAASACGLPARLAETMGIQSSARRVGDCFGTVSPNDLIDPESRAKVCGIALKVHRSAALVQASLPFREPELDPRAVLIGGQLGVVKPWSTELFPEAASELLARRFGSGNVIMRL